MPLLLFSALLTLAYAQDTTRLAGAVYDPTDVAIAGANVRLISLERILDTKTAADGSFEFDNVSLTDYDLEITAPGFKKRTISGNLRNNPVPAPLYIKLGIDMGSCGAPPSITYKPLEAGKPRLSGAVRAGLGPRRPIRNAVVTLTRTGEHEPAFVSRLDKSGKYSFSDPPPGRYDLQISKGGYWPVDVKRLLLPAANIASIDAELTPHGLITVCQ